MLPDNHREMFLRWTRGDEYAADFLEDIANVARLADDIVDEDENRQRNMCWLLYTTLTKIPTNPFYLAHLVELKPLITNILIQWHQSDEWRSGRDARKRTFGFVYRENVGGIAMAVAGIIGGYEHARAVADEYFETCLSWSDETVEQWVKE